MINEIAQWSALAFLGFIVLYPKVRRVVEDFKKAEEEE